MAKSRTSYKKGQSGNELGISKKLANAQRLWKNWACEQSPEAMDYYVDLMRAGCKDGYYAARDIKELVNGKPTEHQEVDVKVEEKKRGVKKPASVRETDPWVERYNAWRKAEAKEKEGSEPIQ